MNNEIKKLGDTDLMDETVMHYDRTNSFISFAYENEEIVRFQGGKFYKGDEVIEDIHGIYDKLVEFIENMATHAKEIENPEVE
jgi:hypothetical protein